MGRTVYMEFLWRLWPLVQQVILAKVGDWIWLLGGDKYWA